MALRAQTSANFALCFNVFIIDSVLAFRFAVTLQWNFPLRFQHFEEVLQYGLTVLNKHYLGIPFISNITYYYKPNINIFTDSQSVVN